MSGEVVRYRFGSYDRIVLDGKDCRWVSSDKMGHVFETVERSCSAFAMTHAQVHEAVQAPGYDYSKNHHSVSCAEVRLRSGVDDISELPLDEQLDIRVRFEYVERFVDGVKSGRFSRSAKGYDDAAEALEPEVNAVMLRIRSGGVERKGRIGNLLPAGQKGPSGRTLRRLVATLKKSDGKAASLRLGTRRSGNRARKVKRLVAEFLNVGVNAYMSRRMRSGRCCLKIVHRLIREHNRRVEKSRENFVKKHRRMPERHEIDEILDYPAQSTLDRIIEKLYETSRFNVIAAREGVEVAEREGASFSSGQQTRRPGERLEIDHWYVPLVVILEMIGLDEALSKEQIAKFQKVTVWACVVYDKATRCVLGLSITANPSTASSVAALELAVSPKARYAASVGSRSGWPMQCSGDCVVTDSGSEFIGNQFWTKLLDLRTAHHTSIAKMPEMRAGIERLFGIKHAGFVSQFRGRTFKGENRDEGYVAAEHASITLDDLIQTLLRYVLDVYHNTPHGGIGGMTPARMWKVLVRHFDVAPPPGRDIRRHVFGLEMPRTLGPHGITMLGLRYTSMALREVFRNRGTCEVVVRVAPLDLGAISMRVPGEKGWMVLDCCTAGFDGISMPEWEQMAVRLQTRFASDAELTTDVVDEALEDIRRVSRRRIPVLGLGRDTPTREVIEAAEHRLGIGFTMPDRTVGGQATMRNLLTGGVPRGGGAIPQPRTDAVTPVPVPVPVPLPLPLPVPVPVAEATEDAAGPSPTGGRDGSGPADAGSEVGHDEAERQAPAEQVQSTPPRQPVVFEKKVDFRKFRN